jgi:triosephosphate isomerase
MPSGLITMRRKLVAGNWKMHGGLAQNAELLDAVRSGVAALPGIDCAVCVPFPYLAQAQQKLSGSAVKWGAQNVHQLDKGAYTGEVSAAMLRDFGCSHVIVGHSERRAYYGESSHLVAEKFLAAQKAGLLPILCVGESLEQRESGITEQVVAGQLDALIQLGGVQSLRGAVVAYEPVWAIGTGKTATSAQAQAVHAFIRQRVASHDGKIASGLCILYGGSVKAGNAAELFAMPDIDGGLIGGASLVADEFLAICRAGQI